jgi:hypothetical protein
LIRVPGWRQRVERSMAAALGPDGFERAHVTGYFRHLADLFTFSAAVYRSGVHAAGLDREWFHGPASAERYRRALEGGKGAQAIKQRWYTAIGVGVAYRPQKGSELQ